MNAFSCADSIRDAFSCAHFHIRTCKFYVPIERLTAPCAYALSRGTHFHVSISIAELASSMCPEKRALCLGLSI
jgi:hypothetical protein